MGVYPKAVRHLLNIRTDKIHMQKTNRDRKRLVELFGEAFSLEEMAEYLGVDKKWLREHHLKLGGIRLGRKFLFFEKRIEREINNADFYKEEGQMAELCEEERTKKTEDVSDTRTGIRLGGKREKAPTKKELLRRDKHGLLDTSH
jgi:hypothetical protein